MTTAPISLSRTIRNLLFDDLERRLRELGAKVAMGYDWDTDRLTAGFADEVLLAELLAGFERGSAAFEFGHGDGSSSLFRSRLGLANFGIGDCRLMLTLPAVARACLRAAFPDADREAVAVASLAIAGELLAPDFDERCPRPAQWEGDGLDLACYMVGCMSESPELVMPSGRDYARANRDGSVSYLRVPDAAADMLSALAALTPGNRTEAFSDAVYAYAFERHQATESVAVADFGEASEVLASGPGSLGFVQDVRSLAHAPEGIALAGLASAAERLTPGRSLLVTDAVCEAYSWRYRGDLVSGLARAGRDAGVCWWVVLDGRSDPVGAVAARDWDQPPVRTLRPGHTLAPVDARSGRVWEASDAARR